MNIDEAIAQLDELINNFDAEMMAISEEAAINLKTLVIHRIQTEGIGKTYSTNKIPAYLLLLDESRLDTQQTINYVKAKEEADEEVNWADVRQAHGNQTAFVDLTFTGRMFQGVGILKTEKIGDVYLTTIGGFDEEVRKKLRWNAERYGQYFAANKEEDKMIADVVDARIKAMEAKYIRA